MKGETVSVDSTSQSKLDEHVNKNAAIAASATEDSGGGGGGGGGSGHKRFSSLNYTADFAGPDMFSALFEINTKLVQQHPQNVLI